MLTKVVVWISFYPGISSVRDELAAIGGPGTNARAEAIPAPEDAAAVAGVDAYSRLDEGLGPGHRYDGSASSGKSAAYPLRPSPASARAPRVVGSFDHAVLPMPPVCLSSFRGTILNLP